MNPSGKISRHFLIIRLANRWSIVLFEFEKWYRIKMVWINSSYCMFPLIRLENVDCGVFTYQVHKIWPTRKVSNQKMHVSHLYLKFENIHISYNARIYPLFWVLTTYMRQGLHLKKIYNFRTYVPEMIFFTWFTYMEVSGWRRTGLVSQCYRFNNRMKKSSWEIILSLFKLNFFFCFLKNKLFHNFNEIADKIIVLIRMDNVNIKLM